jgi:hypothetical protein
VAFSFGSSISRNLELFKVFIHHWRKRLLVSPWQEEVLVWVFFLFQVQGTSGRLRQSKADRKIVSNIINKL